MRPSKSDALKCTGKHKMWRSPMKYRPYDQKAFILMKKHKIPKKWWYETGSKLENAIKHGACESKKRKRGPPILVHFYGFGHQLVANSLKCRTAGHTDTRRKGSQRVDKRDARPLHGPKHYKTRCPRENPSGLLDQV